MKYIKLQTWRFIIKFAIVDDEDYDLLMNNTWSLKVGYAGRTCPETNNHIYMHRVIMKTPTHLVVDHINGNKLDNRKSNLRNVTHQQNCFNSKKRFNKTGFTGVYCTGKVKRYYVNIRIKGEKTYLGDYSTPELAAEVYQNAAKQYQVIDDNP